MPHASLPVIAALIALFVSDGAVAEPAALSRQLSVVLGTLWLPAVALYIVGLMASRMTAGDVPAQRHWTHRMRHLATAVEIMLVGIFVWHAVYGSLSPLADRLETVVPLDNVRRLIAVLPLIAAILLVRLAVYEVQSDHRIAYVPVLSFQLKLMALPLAPLLAYVVLDDMFGYAPLGWRVFAVSYPYTAFLVPLLLIGAAHVYAPVLLKLVWRTTLLRDRDLTQRVRDIADRHRITYRRVSVAFARGVRIANAAVAGILPRSREVLVTDRLLHRLDNDEVEGVLAHELGHIKHRHMWLYLAYSVSYFGAYLTVFATLERWVPQVLTSSPVAPWLLIVSFFYVYFVLLFGVLSRAFERQADVFAVMNIRDPEAYPRALATLAELHDLPTRARRLAEWAGTHPPIGRRIELAERAIEDGEQARSTAGAAWIKRGILVSVPTMAVAAFLLRGTLLPSDVEIVIARAALRLEEVETLRMDLAAMPQDDPARGALTRGIAVLTAEAREELEGVSADTGNDVDALYLYGLTSVYSRRWEVAASALDRALERDPRHIGALYATALLAHERGEDGLAVQMIDRAHAVRPDDPQIAELRDRLLALRPERPPSVSSPDAKR